MSQPSTAMRRWYLFSPGCVFDSVTDEGRKGLLSTPAYTIRSPTKLANEPMLRPEHRRSFPIQ
jgi:hypothetical protein